MKINGKWYTEPQLEAYVMELQGELKEAQEQADNGKRQIALYEDESRKLKDILALAKSEAHRPYPAYKYRWETELEKLLENETTVYHKVAD